MNCPTCPVSTFKWLILLGSKGRLIHLMSKRSQPVAVGRKRKRHELADCSPFRDQQMQGIVERKNEETKEPDGDNGNKTQPWRSKRNKTVNDPNHAGSLF